MCKLVSQEGCDHVANSAVSIWPIIVICFTIVVFDGLDTISITFVAPTIATIWDMPASAMAPVFMAASIGAVIGYIAAGPMAIRLGDRRVMLLSVAVFGIGSLASATATDILGLATLRLMTSVGLGAVLPLAVGAASSVVSPARRSTTAILITTGLSAGGVLAGILGGPLIQNYGWQSIFIVGGILPLLLLPAIVCFFPASSREHTVAGKENAILGLFAGQLALRTILLWLFAFVVFVEAYAVLYWTPTLLINWGMPSEMAPASAAVLSMGGLFGGVILVFLVVELSVVRSLMVYGAFGLGCILVFAHGSLDKTIMMVVFGIGAGLVPCCMGQAALAVSFYPGHLRATGVGFAAAAGRIGSVVGPGLGGAVIALGWSTQQIVLMAAVPSIFSVIILVAIHILGPIDIQDSQIA
ncbi:MFS transporter [Neorhizobium galegae]|uniref:4-hydroxybenzoate transporter n=1 Tax=Neorhizobium galegae bv. orientalis str. HAMBI 540 TaxID=1028800 RepID=A0A068SZX1_NEOGA|nr:MFS transporter [Neorhizobium galegae]KAB1119831.1 aromatic acid/H+ symport family MFS transporter [Neorhizobium galegae]MCQ1575273.1 MFS transporter [Neorhizobium galegae]MCQ1810853.1 MFS transporter [Neorhizobium galegae]MCQ1839127.1 MFS transporter [Neorhizobium galegae]MCQ1855824.1 MFS transporter [Neorhizobium galegae]